MARVIARVVVALIAAIPVYLVLRFLFHMPFEESLAVATFGGLIGLAFGPPYPLERSGRGR
jgi:hypothetical protein